MQTHPALLLHKALLSSCAEWLLQNFEFMRIISYCSSRMLLVSAVFSDYQMALSVGCLNDYPTYQFVKTLIQLKMCSWTFPSLVCVYVSNTFCLHPFPVKAGMLLSCLFVCVGRSQWLFKHGVLLLITNRQACFQKNANLAWSVVGTTHLVDMYLS